jgi:uncharacterized protein YndB with AHSA1/START domain/uncharacterized damage-inducible protein DinB
MSSNERSIQQEQFIKAPTEHVYEALTVAGDLAGWLCDYARTAPRPGGRFEARWRSGYEARGHFTELRPDGVGFSWRGTDEPGETRVWFDLIPAEGGTLVRVTHSGFGPEPEWEKPLAEAEKGWSMSLENLASLLETGIDLRLARQPFLGVGLEPLDAQRAAREGIAAEAGVYLTNVIEGAGAQAAGLQKGDVIVAIEDVEVRDFDSLVAGLRAYRAGDGVEMTFVRGQERMATTVELGSRPRPEVPEDLDALVARVEAEQAKVNGELAEAVAGLTEDLAGREPAPGEWSVKQTLAHLSVTERDILYWYGQIILGEWASEMTGNPSTVPEKLAMTLAAAPAVPALLERFQQDQAESLAFIRSLRPDIVARKARYRRIAEMALEMFDHTREHIGQIRAAAEVAQGG